MAMPGKRKRHGPQRRFMDAEEEGMQRGLVSKERVLGTG